MALMNKMKYEIAQEPPFCWFLYSSFLDGWTFSVQCVLLWNMLPHDLCSPCIHQRVQKLMAFLTMLGLLVVANLEINFEVHDSFLTGF